MKSEKNNRAVFLRGMRDGLPIGLGYLAVSFSLGIAARNIGMTALQGFIMSWFGVASAGEYAAMTVIGAAAPYIEMVLVSLIANARYLLMSFALSQRLDPKLSVLHRLLIGYAVTDELFGIAVAQQKPLEPAYSYGSYTVAIPMWAIGTALGVVAGNILPQSIVSALSVALFGMFIAVIIPPAKQNRVVLLFVTLSFAASYAASRLPLISSLSGSARVIILTLVLGAAAAVFFPVKPDETEEADT
ncbi:MAG: AzlC family ABC transporter permease [Oscillospiraceae bacterium]|nr:AzlC family ABC transporter permease [Oscillospiraceae bacterium]